MRLSTSGIKLGFARGVVEVARPAHEIRNRARRAIAVEHLDDEAVGRDGPSATSARALAAALCEQTARRFVAIDRPADKVVRSGIAHPRRSAPARRWRHRRTGGGGAPRGPILFASARGLRFCRERRRPRGQTKGASVHVKRQFHPTADTRTPTGPRAYCRESTIVIPRHLCLGPYRRRIMVRCCRR